MAALALLVSQGMIVDRIFPDLILIKNTLSAALTGSRALVRPSTW
jgi:hypothetical protein